MRRRTRILMRRVRTLIHMLLAGLIVGAAYFGPMVIAVLSVRLPDFGEDVKIEPAVQYMASMSLTPFPDPSAEVIEVTEELMKPPGEQKVNDKPAEPEVKETKTEAAAPIEAQEGPGKVIKSGGQTQKEPSGSDGQRVGGKVKGPTQDGKGNKAQECLPPNPDIKQVDTYRYRVKADVIDYYVNHMRAADDLAYTSWVTNKKGETRGFRVARIRCGNDLYQAGFRGGDVVLAINGEEVTSTAQGIRAYLKLRNSSVLRVKVRRQKQNIVLIYRLV